MILDMFFGLFKSINSIFGSQFMLYGVLVLGVILVGMNYFKKMGTALHEVLYFSEPERIGLPLKILAHSPRLLRTEKNMRFLRNSVAYNFRKGKRLVTTYLAKRGTAYTFKIQDGTVKNVGSIYDGVVSIWGQEKVDKLKPEELQQLKTSELFITVELEEGHTPSGFSPMSESDVNTEANLGMANLVGKAIREELEQQDFIKILGLLGAGGCAIFLLNALGIISV